MTSARDRDGVDLVASDPIVVVGVVIEAHFSSLGHVIPTAWEQLWSRPDVDHFRVFTEVSFALEDGHYRELLGFRVGEVVPVPEGMELVIVPAGEWVSATAADVTTIASRFGEMQAWGRRRGREHNGVLVDDGYHPTVEFRHRLLSGVWEARR